MSKHHFHETTHAVTDSRYHRVIYCQWCGLVVWDFNRFDVSKKELQTKAGTKCEANPIT